MNDDSRGPWYLLTGLVIGAILGIVFAWRIQPLQYTDTAPGSLAPEYKDRYRAMIALSYGSTGDLLRARARLELLEDPDLYRTLAEQAQRTLAGGSDPDEARALGMLAVALGQAPGPAQAVTQTPTQPVTPSLTPTGQTSTAEAVTNTPIPMITVTPTATPVITVTPVTTPTMTAIAQLTAAVITPSPTPKRKPTATETPVPRPTQTPWPTPTPSRTPGAPFVLVSQEQICGQALDKPRLQVEVSDAAGNPVPGVEVVVTWAAGEQHFYTGLKPELGLGYADFSLTPGTLYSLQVGQGGQTASGLTAVQCRQGAQTTWGAWRLVFVQP